MKILVVDREEELQPVLDLLQKTPGNEIRAAHTGEEALKISGDWGGADLLITEVFMEPMNGFTLRNKMENRHPGTRTIFLSGWDLAAYADHTAGYEVVAKPAAPENLFPAISRTMAGGYAMTIVSSPAETFLAERTVVASGTAPETAQSETAPNGTAPAEAAPAAPPPAAPPPSAPQPSAPQPSAPQPSAPQPSAPQPSAPQPSAPQPSVAPRPAAVSAPSSAPRLPSPRAVPNAAAPAGPPRAGAVPRAVPRPAAQQPGAAPAAPRLASPAAAGAPRVAARPAVVAAVPKAAAPADPLVGKVLGNYRVQTRLGEGNWGPVYLAIQTSMDRPVAMEVLADHLQNDEAARHDFVATARAKAAVQHPHILSVYEADQAEGRLFYTHEYVDGTTLAELTRTGQGLSEPMALQTVKYVAQALANLHHQKVAHSIPDASDIYLGADNLPHLSNVAQAREGMPELQKEINVLSATVRATLPGGTAKDPGLQDLLIRMGITGPAGFHSWPALFQAIQAIEPKVVPADAFRLSAQDEAAIRAVEEARKRQKRQVLYALLGLFVFLWAAGFLVWWKFLRPDVPDYSKDMVEIPAGEFIYQAGQKITLPAFWIDRYEVTMSEYAQFLAYLAAHGNTTEFDHPLQPKGQSHIPPNWEIYYGRAGSSLPNYRTVSGVPISLDCPVFNVNYFDAYAYAKWKGRRLPTQQEWEKAARGTSGNLYPWGNDWSPKYVNAGGDYEEQPSPGYKPGVDGYVWWAPVAALTTDKSPYGVIGMAGNVSEWTDSWDASRTYVIIRGGNFKSNSEQAKTTAQILNAYPQKAIETLGFRTVSDKPPGP